MWWVGATPEGISQGLLLLVSSTGGGGGGPLESGRQLPPQLTVGRRPLVGGGGGGALEGRTLLELVGIFDNWLLAAGPLGLWGGGG